MTALAHPQPLPGWQTGDAPVDPTRQWADWPATWPAHDSSRWGPALPARHPRPPARRDLARAGWDRGTYRRQLAADLRAAIVELHRIDVPWVRRGGHRLGDRWHRALLALDRLIGHARHEIIAAAEHGLDIDALDAAEIADLARRPDADPDTQALRDLLDAEHTLAHRRDRALARDHARPQRGRRP